LGRVEEIIEEIGGRIEASESSLKMDVVEEEQARRKLSSSSPLHPSSID